MEMLKAKVNEVDLAYMRIGSGTPLILLHGYPLDHSIWEPLVPLLKDDFDIIMPDLRGFGESSLLEAPATPYQISDMAEEIAQMLDELKLKKVVMAGHSMGGYVALAFSLVYPKRLLGLVLVASQAAADNVERKAGRYVLAERVETNGVGEVADGMPALLTADVNLQASLKELILKQSPAGVAGALRAMAERPKANSLLVGFKQPLRIIHGADDKIMPIERAREMLYMNNGELSIIEGAGHMPMMESAQRTAEVIKTLRPNR
jgi:3-oxoadipate enol-lactonase